ncbi:class I SAM-dependent methyltransferase [Fusibacter sp. 3D3]|uniref:class I SAM-dependent methyltransferase n=1 Tax=Fusibacter sp. 3D3 TaxID=1048380 RepID=UPI0008535CED|nr:class I SAM-dependent methyltransferase [Fusibacter sp. 3D3]GAU78871.1 methlytransferase [Fusibacter sp. 3D3]
MSSNKDYFNSKAELWDNIVDHDLKKVQRIIDLVEIKKGDKILDVGTGTGVLIPVLQACVGDQGQITAIDIAEKMIEVAKRKFDYSNVEFVVGDVLEKGVSDSDFDCIICYSMFPHFEDKKAAISTLAKHLKKNGKLVICHSQSRDAINHLHQEIPGPVQEDRLPSMDILKQMFESADINVSLEIDDEELFVIIGLL